MIRVNGILWTLLGTLLTFSVTTLGAAGVFFVREVMDGKIQSAFLGFAGGVMIAASVWSLLIPGIKFAEENGQISWFVVSGGFLIGVLLLLVVDYLLEKKMEIKLKKSTSMLIMAITAHNIPEGMPWFLSFAAGAMIYVVVQELIPEACAGYGEKSGT